MGPLRQRQGSAPLLRPPRPTRIRTQRGLRERFAEGVRISRRYLAEMEEIFRARGSADRADPPAARRVVLRHRGVLEGGRGRHLAVHAVDRAELHAIGGVVDERRDPLRATRGAARI